MPLCSVMSQATKPIDLKGWRLRKLRISGESVHCGHDFLVQSNADTSHFDYLLFFDSRGISRKYDHSLAHLLASSIARAHKTYLLICRPLNLTIWASLISFLRLNNDIKPSRIITNMGFVDITPKKRLLSDDTVRQVEAAVGCNVACPYFVEHYASSDGAMIPLYSMKYSHAYNKSIENIAASSRLVILNTPLTQPSLLTERKRPLSFFKAQVEANAFNYSIKGAQVVEFPSFNESFTYDHVHYTDLGNKLIFDRIQAYL